jgi:intracellular sulfur oxidation DsrE/DsrF family protein
MLSNRLTSSFALLPLLLLCGNHVASAQSSNLPVPGVEAAADIPNAHLVPNPSTTYKVLFDLAAPMKPTEKYAGLDAVARYVNTLAKFGVPPEHRKVAIVFHQGSTDIVMNDAAFKSRYEGQGNPNIEMIRALKRAGVELHVCGQAVRARKIDPATIQPEIQLDLWALTTIIELQSQGYVRIGGGS